MKTVKSHSTVRRFAAEFPACWGCGVAVESRTLHSHHIIGGAGRSDERCNLARLKRKHDPQHYDRGRLADLAHRATLPRAARPKGMRKPQ